MPWYRHTCSTLVGLITLLLAACSQPTPPPTPVPTSAPAPTAAPTTVPVSTPAPTVAAANQRSDAELAAKLDDFLTKMSKDRLISGIVTVKRNQVIVLQKGYGFANREQQIPFTPQTVFRIGELNMQFTAAATLLLEQQGKLSVQDPVCNYIDPCPAAWKPITLHHLLSHTSGITDYTGTSAGEKLGQTGATTNQILELIRDKPLEFTPGSKRVYSHSGFVLLGLVIERVSGQSYADYLHKQIFEPLGMQHSGYGNPTETLALGYLNTSNTQAHYDVSALGASGGLYTTTDDLLRWIDGLYGKKVLNATQLAKMLTNHAAFGDQNNRGSGYGIVLATVEGHRLFGQGGGPLGYGSVVNYYPDDDLSVILLGNQDNVDILTIDDTLEKIALGIT